MDSGPHPLIARMMRLHEMSGASAREIDRLAGLNENTFGLWKFRLRENPRSLVDVATLAAYSQMFGVSLDWIVSGKGQEPIAEHVVAAVIRARALRNGEANDAASPTDPTRGTAAEVRAGAETARACHDTDDALEAGDARGAA